MNERIEQLVKQATSTVSVNHEGYRGKGYTEQVEFFDKEKFAELIVRECAKVSATKAGVYDKDAFVAKRIKEYFGVEE